jgi:GT2 family glycosyltransferase
LKTSIVILTYNKLDYTKVCIDSIRTHTQPGTYEIIVVDNCSTDGTVEWLQEQRDIITIFNQSNLGFPRGCNQGIDVAIGNDVLLLNNDVIVTRNWLDNMRAALYSSKSVGAVGSVTNSCSNYQAISVNYSSIEEMQEFAAGYNRTDSAKWEERIRLVGFCMLIKKEVIEKIGLLDERFTPGNYEDDDYSFRITKAGFKLLLCRDTFIHHFGSTSFKENKQSYIDLMATNQKKFEEKWGFSPNYSAYIRFDLIDQIDEPLDAKLKVLEVGCACGGTLLQIKNRYKHSELYGMEINPHTASIASFYANVSSANLEYDPLDYLTGYFDYIILGNVLEHLHDPWEVLKKLTKHLKYQGKMLISFPNVMHYSVIRGLMNGRWNYEDAGILDRTHLRFFTLKELQAMLKEVGFPHVTYGMTRLSNNEEDENFITKLVELSGVCGREEFSAYQYVVKATKLDFRIDLDQSDITSLKFLFRRLEFDVEPAETASMLTDFLRRKPADKDQLAAIVEEFSIEKDKVLNRIAVSCFENSLYDYVIPVLEMSLQKNPDNPETLFNLGFLSFQYGEPAIALQYLEKISPTDDEVLSLIGQIKGENNEQSE